VDERAQQHSKPDVIRTSGADMRRVDGATVTRLALGDLPRCLPGHATPRGVASRAQESAAAVVAGRTPVKGQTPSASRPDAFARQSRRRHEG